MHPMPRARSPIAGKPPLAVSPRRLRPRLPPRAAPVTQTPPAATTKIQIPNRSPASGNSLLRHEHEIVISSELLALAKMVKEEFSASEGCGDIGVGFTAAAARTTGTPLFERGRLYEAYSARRNERLLKRKIEEAAEEAVGEDPAVAVELGKRRAAKKVENLRRSVPADFSAGRASSLRSSLRSSKEMRKSAAPGCSGRSSMDGGRRNVTRSVRRI